MIIECSKCRKKYDLDKAQLSKGAIKVRCPNCRHVWVIKPEFRKEAPATSISEVTQPYVQQPEVEWATQPKLLPVEDLISLRALVGFLGEKPQFKWWDTNFLSETGLKFLEITFPRSSLAAGINSVTAAARRVHDGRIGKKGVYHLFRLPLSIEQIMHESLTQLDHSSLLASIKTRDLALEKLRNMTNGGSPLREGPVQIGTHKDLFSLVAARKIGRCYADAFAEGKQTFPYFLAVGNESV